MEKKAGNAEGMVGDLARRLLLLEENAIKSEERKTVLLYLSNQMAFFVIEICS